MELIDKTKDHFRRNKDRYICFAAGAAFVGIAIAIMRGRHAENSLGSDGPSRVTVRPLNFIAKECDTNVVHVIQRSGRGHPGYIVRCLETNEVFASQSHAADALGISEKIISKQLNGEFGDAKGLHFERIAA